MQAELASQRQRAEQAEAALAEVQASAQQLSQTAEQTRQEKAQAEQQASQLRAVEGQLQVAPMSCPALTMPPLIFSGVLL